MAVSFDVNVFNIVVGLSVFVINKLFIDRLDKLQSSFEKMAERLEQYVKVQDHKDDLAEVKRRLEKVEDEVKDIRVGK